MQKKAYFLFEINLITRSKKIWRLVRSLKICGTIHWWSDQVSSAPLLSAYWMTYQLNVRLVHGQMHIVPTSSSCERGLLKLKMHIVPTSSSCERGCTLCLPPPSVRGDCWSSGPPPSSSCERGLILCLPPPPVRGGCYCAYLLLLWEGVVIVPTSNPVRGG